MNEIWKDVLGYEGKYQVSDQGNVMSHKTSRILKQAISPAGYRRVGLYNGSGKQKKKFVHRLVAEAFFEDHDEVVNHKDGNKLNNKLSNLEWVTQSYNIKHAYTTGLNVFPTGQAHFNTKNTDDEIRAMRIMYKTGHYYQHQLAKMFGVNQQTVSRIINRGSWSSVK